MPHQQTEIDELRTRLARLEAAASDRAAVQICQVPLGI
jgi:hypothetical protein